MRIIDVLTSPWAIVPAKLFEIRKIYATHLRGEKIDIAAIEARIGESRPDDAEEKRYQVMNQMAVIQIHGVIAKRMNLFSRISGGVSTELIGADVKDAVARPEIKGILLDIDSPGGTVDGTEELGRIIFEGREQKPIVAYTDGMMDSAAYWIGSAAQEIYISGQTVEVGSIGVVAAHVDYSEWEKKVGIKTTEIYAGKYKRIASQYKPLSTEGKQSIQDVVDYLYSIFVNQVAVHRGVNSETVLENMADGKIFKGEQAVSAGLVDGVSTFDQAIERLTVMQSEMAEGKRLAALNVNLRRELS